MKEIEKKVLKCIAEWESCSSEGTDFTSLRLRGGKVLKAEGFYLGKKCYWDGFGLAYHAPSGKRFRFADVEFDKILTNNGHTIL